MSKKKKGLIIAIISLCIIIFSTIMFLSFNFFDKTKEDKSNTIEDSKVDNIDIEKEEQENDNSVINENEELEKEEEVEETKKEEVQEEKKEESKNNNQQTTNKKENNNSSSSINNNTSSNSNNNTNNKNNTSEKQETNTNTNTNTNTETNNSENEDDIKWNNFLQSPFTKSVLETSTPDFYSREEQMAEQEKWFKLGYRVEEPVVCLDLSSGKKCAYSLIVFLPKGVCNETTEDIRVDWRKHNYIGVVAYAKSIGYKCEGYQD